MKRTLSAMLAAFLLFSAGTAFAKSHGGRSSHSGKSGSRHHNKRSR